MLAVLAGTTITLPFNVGTVVLGLVLFGGGCLSGVLGVEAAWKGFFGGVAVTVLVLLVGWAMSGAFG